MSRFRSLYRANGPGWMARFVVHEAVTGVQRFMMRAERRLKREMKELELARRLPGTNTRDANRETWSRWDWSRGGEEWTARWDWKQGFIDDVILRHLDGRGAILEVGPGAGRWTETLHKVADRLILTDITPKCIELCKERFADVGHIEYHVNDGATLPFLESGSLDAVFSFDVFVHIAPNETRSYLAEFARVLKPGGIGVIHHPDENVKGDWRSGVTAALFDELLRDAGLRLERRFDSWGESNQYTVSNQGDQISVFVKS